MKTEILSVTLCGAMVLFAPWQLNVLFYVWLTAAVLRVYFKIKRVEEAAIAKTTADRDQNVAELNAYRASHKAELDAYSPEEARNPREKAAIAKWSATRDQNLAELNACRPEFATRNPRQRDGYMQYQNDKHMQHQQHQKDKQTQHQQHQQDKEMQYKQDKQDKLDHQDQRKSADQATPERGFVTKNNMLFK